MCSCPPPPHPPLPPSAKTKQWNSGNGTKWCGSSFSFQLLFTIILFKEDKTLKFATFQGFLFSVNSFCCYCLRVLYFLLFFFVYFHIFFFSSSISLFSFSFFLFCCCCSYFFGIVESKRQKGTEVGLAYISWFSGTETAKSKKKNKKKKRAKGSFLLVSSLDFHVAAMSQHPHWHQVQKRCVCWRFCKYVQMWKYKLPRMKKQKKKCTYSSHKRIPSRPGDKNDSVFININIYWVWQPSDCYMHFLGKLEDLYGSSFSTL